MKPFSGGYGKVPERRGTLILSIGVTLVVAGLIVWFSSQSAADSDSLSHGMARRLLKLFSTGTSAQELRYLNHFLRKLAHLTLYLILGCGLTGITLHKLRRMPMAVCVSVLLGAVFAASDEFHQFFSEGRGPSVQDVLLDTCGVAAGSLFFALFKYCLFKRVSRPGD